MPYDRTIIAPINSGLQTDVKEWLIPEDAVAYINNAYIYRGRFRKKYGTRYMNSAVAQSVAQLYSRVRIQVGTIGSPDSNAPGAIFQAGQLFSAGTQIFTVISNTAGSQPMLATGPGTGTFDVSTGAFSLSGTGLGNSTPIYFYPAQPITGLPTYQTADSTNDPTYAFDTQFSYYFDTGTGGWALLSDSFFWTGDYTNLFWATTWQGATPDLRYLFVTNNNPPDGITYWDGATWTTLAPTVNADSDTLVTALMIVTFKNHLVVFSPTTSAATYTNMAMWAAFGDPTATNAWNNSIPGQGNNLVAATMEDIKSCEFVKDRLIVYFERSTYEFAYTGNQANPFAWYQLNTELGTESTFSTVPFDKVALTVGNTGLHSCNGVNVERFDQKIPLEVWNARTGDNQVNLIYGIRDYYAEQVYWTFPNNIDNMYSSTFPNKILSFNYLTGSWALFDDSITCFGYVYSPTQAAITWSSTDITWDNDSITWESGTAQALNQYVLAGNQEGYVFIVDTEVDEQAGLLQITNLVITSNGVTITCINHNLNVNQITKPGDQGIGVYVYLQNLNGLTATTSIPFALFYPVIAIIDANTFVIGMPNAFDINASLAAFQVYTGGGTISRVPAVDIYTKQFNPYISQDRNVSIAKVDFLVEKTDSSEFSVDYLVGTSAVSNVANAIDSGSLIGSSTVTTAPYIGNLYPIEQYQERLWHPIYPIAEGNAVQLRIYYAPSQLANSNVFFQPFQLHAMTLYTTMTSYRAQ